MVSYDPCECTDWTSIKVATQRRTASLGECTDVFIGQYMPSVVTSFHCGRNSFFSLVHMFITGVVHTAFPRDRPSLVQSRFHSFHQSLRHISHNRHAGHAVYPTILVTTHTRHLKRLARGRVCCHHTTRAIRHRRHISGNCLQASGTVSHRFCPLKLKSVIGLRPYPHPHTRLTRETADEYRLFNRRQLITQATGRLFITQATDRLTITQVTDHICRNECRCGDCCCLR